jgi:hypothetical protein
MNVEHTRELTVGELTSKYKTIAHFVDAYRQYGKVLPEDLYIGWNYVRQLVTGEKLLVEQKQLEGFSLPPKRAD